MGLSPLHHRGPKSPWYGPAAGLDKWGQCEFNRNHYPNPASPRLIPANASKPPSITDNPTSCLWTSAAVRSAACTSAASPGSARPWAWTSPARRSRSSSPTRCSARSPPICRMPWASTWCCWAGRGTCSASKTRAGSPGPSSTARPSWCPPGSIPPRRPTATSYMYPEGDQSVPPSGRMPKGGFYFDSVPRQQPIDENRLDPQDNLEEFGPVSDADLEYYRRRVRSGSAARATGRSWPISAAPPSATSPWCPPPG